ncbi:MAG: DEAD/DEAH box helicase family protein, partial [Sulfuricurvum sp.]|uniref:primosomal protein N' family DNA-binding protein n=1 Tax=Sulfuricurvum sp. TaxID=2025608 RepID=UPI0025EBAF5A
MYFYHIALLGSPLELLTYHCENTLLIGSEVEVALSTRILHGVIIAPCDKPDFATQPISEICDLFYSSNQIKTAQFMSDYYGCSLGEALNLFVPYPVLSEFMVRQAHHERIAVSITLSETQSQALDFIRLQSVSLLFGDTGAGKSEIYMSRMDEVLSEGKRALLLLPEISLTPQMEKRFKNHFGDAVVLWHSKMTPKQKKVTLAK